MVLFIAPTKQAFLALCQSAQVEDVRNLHREPMPLCGIGSIGAFEKQARVTTYCLDVHHDSDVEVALLSSTATSSTATLHMQCPDTFSFSDRKDVLDALVALLARWATQ